MPPWLTPVTLITGAASSMLIGPSVVWLLFPAASVALPFTLCPPPSMSVFAGGQEAIPESASEQVKLTFTSALNQAFAFGDRSVSALTVGGVLSIETSAVSSATFPALLTAFPVTL